MWVKYVKNKLNWAKGRQTYLPENGFQMDRQREHSEQNSLWIMDIADCVDSQDISPQDIARIKFTIEVER